jgi:hypothetical protein
LPVEEEEGKKIAKSPTTQSAKGRRTFSYKLVR